MTETEAKETGTRVEGYSLQDPLLDLINSERKRQIRKWGRQKHSNATWNLILGEEFGEVSKAILERKTPGEVYSELVQTIAVAVAWFEDHWERGEFAPEIYGESHEEALAKWEKAQRGELV